MVCDAGPTLGQSIVFAGKNTQLYLLATACGGGGGGGYE